MHAVRVFLKFLQPFSLYFEDTTITLPKASSNLTFKAFIDHLRKELPELYHEICDNHGNVQAHVLCLLNDKIFPLTELMERPLTDGDVITFGYAIGGG